jgi:hypothetical protein
MSSLWLCRGLFFPAGKTSVWLRPVALLCLGPIRIPVGPILGRRRPFPCIAAMIATISPPAPQQGKSEQEHGQVKEAPGEPLVHDFITLTPRAQKRDGFVRLRLRLGFLVRCSRFGSQHIKSPPGIGTLHLQLDAAIRPGGQPIHRGKLPARKETRDPCRFQLDSGQFGFAGRIGSECIVADSHKIVFHTCPL